MPTHAAAEPTLGGMFVCRPAPLYVPRGATAGLTLMSDLHVGAPQVDYKLIKKEVDAATEHGDRLLVNGDVFDAILPGDKKRFSPDALHPRLQGRRDILNAALDWALELLGPAAHLTDMVGVGNHDAAVEKHHSLDPVKLLVYELQKLARARVPDHVIHYGGYTGFVDYRLGVVNHDGRPQGSSKTPGAGAGADRATGCRRWVLYYHHGSGGAAPVTKGMIDFARKDVFVDADCLWLGHKHNRWNAATQRLGCPLTGDDVAVREVRHLMTGGYFRTYVGQSQTSFQKNGRRSNYAADMGLAPQGNGGARVLLRLLPKNDGPPEVQVVQ